MKAPSVSEKKKLLLLLCVALLVDRGTAVYNPALKIESARLYGNIDQYAYYFVDILVGSPPQRSSVILDTGSGLCAFPCASCAHCGKHIDPAFDFSKSSTAQRTACGSGCRGLCKNKQCSYHQGFTEGSSMDGFWFKDYIRLGDAIQHNPAIFTDRLGCHQNENNLFYTQKANGIMGISPYKSGSTIIQELFMDSSHIEGRVFSICLAEWGGRLTVGGYNKTYHRGPIKYVPVNIGSGQYNVQLTGLRVGGRSVSGLHGSTMIDSGTTYVYMSDASHDSLKKEIERYCSRHSKCGATRSGSCWRAPNGLDQFPKVEVVFNKVVTLWGPAGYLYKKGRSNQWCYSFNKDGPGASTVLGATWMQHHEVIFDMARNRIGIVDAACPEYRDRPKHRPREVWTSLAQPLPQSTQMGSVARPVASTPDMGSSGKHGGSGGTSTAKLTSAASAHSARGDPDGAGSGSRASSGSADSLLASEDSASRSSLRRWAVFLVIFIVSAGLLNCFCVRYSSYRKLKEAEAGNAHVPVRTTEFEGAGQPRSVSGAATAQQFGIAEDSDDENASAPAGDDDQLDLDWWQEPDLERNADKAAKDARKTTSASEALRRGRSGSNVVAEGPLE